MVQDAALSSNSGKSSNVKKRAKRVALPGLGLIIV